MKMRFTPEETCIRRTLAKVRGYPRWKSTTITGGFLFYLNSGSWIEEIFPYRDGTWSTGRKSKGTIRYFRSLWEALKYGEELVAPRVKAYNARYFHS
jgi:hypothetical protein